MPTPRFDLIVLAASSGGVSAVGDVLAALPGDFPVPLAVVQHRTSQSTHLPQVWGERTALRVKNVESGERLRPGIVYVAPADHHLELRPDRTLACFDGARVHFQRSSANPILSSAARVLGNRVVAVVLTGSDSDGADGVQEVKANGGVVIAQDQATSQDFEMPRAAIATGRVDHILPLDQIGPALRRLARQGRL